MMGGNFEGVLPGSVITSTLLLTWVSGQLLSVIISGAEMAVKLPFLSLINSALTIELRPLPFDIELRIVSLTVGEISVFIVPFDEICTNEVTCEGISCLICPPFDVMLMFALHEWPLTKGGRPGGFSGL